MLQCKFAAAAKTGVRRGGEDHRELLQDMPCSEVSLTSPLMNCCRNCTRINLGYYLSTLSD